MKQFRCLRFITSLFLEVPSTTERDSIIRWHSQQCIIIASNRTNTYNILYSKDTVCHLHHNCSHLRVVIPIVPKLSTVEACTHTWMLHYMGSH